MRGTIRPFKVFPEQRSVLDLGSCQREVLPCVKTGAYETLGALGSLKGNVGLEAASTQFPGV